MFFPKVNNVQSNIVVRSNINFIIYYQYKKLFINYSIIYYLYIVTSFRLNLWSLIVSIRIYIKISISEYEICVVRP